MVDGGLCETCHEKPGYIVHHRIPLTPENVSNPEVSLNHHNLKYDCKECHDEEEAHAFVKRTKPLCIFDQNGQPVPLLTPPVPQSGGGSRETER